MKFIDTNAQFAELVLSIDWCDAYIRECYFISASYLNKGIECERVLFTPWGEGANLRLLVITPHSNATGGLELMIRGVKTMQLSFSGEVNLSCLIDDWEHTIYLNGRKDAWVSGTAILYSFLDRSIWSPRLRYGDYPPTSDMVPADPIGDGWRLCSNCSEAWQEEVARRYCICPRCLKMTALDE